ncbi:MAG: hypothetical protein JRH01_15975 [Deltaproteobacteria bacterium]|nr:hypothetical protein [Deltaproteobacteria bacterium]
MASIGEEFLEVWHRLVASRDLPAPEKVLATDVAMGELPDWDRLEGRPRVHHLLDWIIPTIEDFTYDCERYDTSRGHEEFALDFRGHVAPLELEGIDLIRLNPQGEVQTFDVMIRPMNALEALRDVIAPKMAAYLRENVR